MKSIYLATTAAVAFFATTASAQFVPVNKPPVNGPRMEQQFWAPKPTALPPYVAPNKPIWRLSEILAAHKGQSDWTQPVVRNRQQESDYISLGVGKSTKPKFYADDRIVFVIWDGTAKVTIDGVEPFTATKGFMVSVPFRHVYSIENVGDKPVLRFEVRHTGELPLYPTSVTPDPLPGITYMKVTGTPGPALIGNKPDDNPIYVDFFKDVAVGDKPSNAKFVWDDNFTSNILRGKGGPVAPDSNKGHFHADWTEFWLIMEGKIGYKLEGMDYFVADPGDVVTAVQGRWHRAGNDPSAPMSTRIPFNPRPQILHNFDIAPPAAPR